MDWFASFKQQTDADSPPPYLPPPPPTRAPRPSPNNKRGVTCRAVPARATRGTPGAVDSDSFTASSPHEHRGTRSDTEGRPSSLRLCRRVLHKECMNWMLALPGWLAVGFCHRRAVAQKAASPSHGDLYTGSRVPFPWRPLHWKPRPLPMATSTLEAASPSHGDLYTESPVPFPWRPLH